jgi:hypothetical protein
VARADRARTLSVTETLDEAAFDFELPRRPTGERGIASGVGSTVATVAREVPERETVRSHG